MNAISGVPRAVAPTNLMFDVVAGPGGHCCGTTVTASLYAPLTRCLVQGALPGASSSALA